MFLNSVAELSLPEFITGSQFQTANEMNVETNNLPKGNK